MALGFELRIVGGVVGVALKKKLYYWVIGLAVRFLDWVDAAGGCRHF